MDERLVGQLLESNLQMTQMTELRPLLGTALQTILASMDADAAQVFMLVDVDPEIQNLGLDRHGNPFLLPEVTIPIQNDGQGAWMNDSLARLPLQLGSQIIGWLLLEKKSAPITQNDVDCLRYYTAQIAAHVDRCVQIDALKKRIADLTAEMQQEKLDRQISEAALAKRAEQIETIHHIGMAITSGLDLQEVIWELYRQCKQVVQVDIFYVALYNPSNEQMNFPLFLDQEKEVSIQPRSLKAEPSLTGYIVQTRKTFYSPDTTSPTAALPVQLLVRRGGSASKSFLGVPLIWRDQIIGILSVQSYQPGAYSPEDIRLMETIATQAAGALEHAQLYAQLNTAWAGTQEANKDLKKALGKMEKLAITDKLTGTYNRRKFDEIIEAEIKRAARYHTPLSMLMLDIDYFKNLNDAFGHHVGDQVLQSFVRIIKAHLRASDSLARWGGDEIIILTPGIDLQKATLLAEKLRGLVEEHHFVNQSSTRVTISVGVAEFHAGESGEDLLRRADTALYQAKANGRNCVIENEN